jgi:hypothetical protein
MNSSSSLRRKKAGSNRAPPHSDFFLHCMSARLVRGGHDVGQGSGSPFWPRLVPAAGPVAGQQGYMCARDCCSRSLRCWTRTDALSKGSRLPRRSRITTELRVRLPAGKGEVN